MSLDLEKKVKKIVESRPLEFKYEWCSGVDEDDRYYVYENSNLKIVISDTNYVDISDNSRIIYAYCSKDKLYSFLSSKHSVKIIEDNLAKANKMLDDILGE